MLYYNQIKRAFSQTSWKSGQVCFREDRVRDVRLNGNQVVAKVQDKDASLETSIVMARGTITTSVCTCPNHQSRETHCHHVAALSIWIVERGSLLRAGVGGEDDGIAPEVEQEQKKRRRAERAAPKVASLRAEPVLYVRGIFQGRTFQGVSIEPGARYTDPETKSIWVDPITQLTRSAEDGRYKNAKGNFIKLTHTLIPILQTIESARVVYQGQSALDNLAKLSASEFRAQMAFHPTIDVRVDPKPLKLMAMNIGAKLEDEKTRLLTYEFASETFKIASEELSNLSSIGRLSSNYVWPEAGKGRTVYRFEMPLASLSRYANRSGVTASETTTGAFRPSGYSMLEDDGAHPLHPLAAYRLSLELGVEDFSVDPAWKEFHEWRKSFEKKKIPELPVEDYGFELRDYQTNGLSWLWSLYHRKLAALLADDMGLGKTHQVLALLTSLYKAKKRPENPSLVVAPTSVVAAWAQKLEKYDTRLRWHIFHGKTRTLPEVGEADIILTTYGILQKEEALRLRDWHIVVLDEAQAIKNASTISSRASRILRSNYRIAMTGTPVENQSTDLWSIMEFLLPGYLGSLPRFKRLYGSGRDMPTQIQASALKRLVSPFLLRRTKSQVLKELPEKTEEVLYCEMTPIQKRRYREYLSSSDAERIRDDLRQEGRKVDYAGILALLTRLKQVCDHPKLPEITAGKIKSLKKVELLESGKWEAVDELIQEALGSNLKVVVFTQYLGMIDLIGLSLKERGIGYVELRGDTLDRAKPLNRFADDPEVRVFLCSLLAGGLGIDLTAGSVCIHLDRWWNPARENQATDRLHRIGQTRGVQVFKMQIKETIEDRIANIIESKMQLSDALIEESPLWLKTFSRKELLELLSPTVGNSGVETDVVEDDARP